MLKTPENAVWNRFVYSMVPVINWVWIDKSPETYILPKPEMDVFTKILSYESSYTERWLINSVEM